MKKRLHIYINIINMDIFDDPDFNDIPRKKLKSIYSKSDFKIIVNGPGQNFSAIFFVNSSNKTIFSAISLECTNTGRGFDMSLDFIS